MSHWHKAIFLAVLAAPAAAHDWTPNLPRMLAGQLPPPAYGVPAPPGLPAASSLVIGHCALGDSADCFKVLQCGLPPEDRPSVRLSGQEIVVVAGHASSSGNFKALEKLANGPDRTRVLVLSPADIYSVREPVRFPFEKPVLLSDRMGHPDTDDGFLGYTFFPFLGKEEDGIIYSPGPYSDSVVNAQQLTADIAATIYHEFQHVILGDFGRSALLAKHGLQAVESAVNAAESEAKANAAHCP